MLGWLLGFSLLWLALTKTVRAGSGPHQPGKPKGIPRVWNLQTHSENTQIQDSFINIRLTIGLDVGKAKKQKTMLSFSQFMSRDKDNNMEDQTRSMLGASRKREGFKRTPTEILKSKRSVPRGEENNMEDKRHCLMGASRRKEGPSILKKKSMPSWSKMIDRRRCLMKALLKKKEMGLRIMKKNAMFSK